MKKHTPLLLILVTIISFVAVGCASIFNNPTPSVNFSSEPSGVTVYINGSSYGKTPTVVQLEAKKTHTIEFKKEGYETRTHIIHNHVGAGWIILDVLGGLLPIIVDAATGNWYELNETNVRIVLEQK